MTPLFLAVRAEPQQLFDYGMSDLLLKPVSMPALRHMLHKWLPRRHSDAADAAAPDGAPARRHSLSKGGADLSLVRHSTDSTRMSALLFNR